MQRPWVSSPSYLAAVAVIIKTRDELDISQAELARRIGKHQSFIAKIESRNRQINVVEFIAVARGLGINPLLLLEKIMNALEDPLIF